MTSGVLSPSYPVQTYPVQHAEQAFRLLLSGKTTDKIYAPCAVEHSERATSKNPAGKAATHDPKSAIDIEWNAKNGQRTAWTASRKFASKQKKPCPNPAHGRPRIRTTLANGKAWLKERSIKAGAPAYLREPKLQHIERREWQHIISANEEAMLYNEAGQFRGLVVRNFTNSEKSPPIAG
ncbi:Uu.00g143830.m01.CDS01 [Anthostomella pinea]|uniref:Uu.00g143830.m01.CDS01 n=1 Tax=Anthostomella pinea TaxID=933095 RepID=A0AAI8VRX5_9PEZI|nr:Uu.00g143830.m01.CDS01 [Anthostomella pinea]